MTGQEVLDKVNAAMEHTRFALHMCEIQAKAGRYFLFEYPVQARSWRFTLVQRPLKYRHVCIVGFDFCKFGMQTDGQPVKKRARIMTNFPPRSRMSLPGFSVTKLTGTCF